MIYKEKVVKYIVPLRAAGPRYVGAANIFLLDRDRLLALDSRRFISIERPRPELGGWWRNSECRHELAALKKLNSR